MFSFQFFKMRWNPKWCYRMGNVFFLFCFCASFSQFQYMTTHSLSSFSGLGEAVEYAGGLVGRMEKNRKTVSQAQTARTIWLRADYTAKFTVHTLCSESIMYLETASSRKEWQGSTGRTMTNQNRCLYRVSSHRIYPENFHFPSFFFKSPCACCQQDKLLQTQSTTSRWWAQCQTENMGVDCGPKPTVFRSSDASQLHWSLDSLS
jgi:hypothetical protein